jgi:Hint domain
MSGDSNLFDQTENLYDTGSSMILGEICFLSGTFITTDQGEVAIEMLDPSIHTFQGKPLVALTKSMAVEKSIVLIPKHALRPNVPSKDTYVSQSHGIFLDSKMVKAVDLLKTFKRVKLVPYHNETLYNVLLDVHSTVSVHNMTCETLHPNHRIAKFYKAVAAQPEILAELTKAMNKQFLISRSSARRSRT